MIASIIADAPDSISVVQASTAVAASGAKQVDPPVAYLAAVRVAQAVVAAPLMPQQWRHEVGVPGEVDMGRALYAPPMVRPLLVIQHVPWEGPHRVLAAFADVPLIRTDALDPGCRLPGPAEVRGAVIMGGPMSVNDADAIPGLAAEVDWVRQAISAGVPLLGICLGAQVIARAAGAVVSPAPRREIGWLPVSIADPRDPVLGPLAPMTVALHWHGEAFTLPDGASALARSAMTPVQAFRLSSAWGVLFHPEADEALVDTWLAEPTMQREAEEVLGPDAARVLRLGARRHAADLVVNSTAGFAAFAARTA